MPPKVRVTKDSIIEAAVDIVRKSGIDELNARNIATALGCSTQPIFSNFASMDEVKSALLKRADELCGEYIDREIESGKYPPYKASGMAYIRFAREEGELFKLIYMRNRSNGKKTEESDLNSRMNTMVSGNTGLDGDRAALFHLEMWIYVHGIAVMIATGYLDLDETLISRILTDSYTGLKSKYESEELL